MLEQRRAKNKGFITLKEAAELSNYSSDYIGQLIRAGKIEGEQVYSNVAWVTTEESVRAYMLAKEKGSYSPKNEESNLSEVAQSFSVYVLYILIGLLTFACLAMFYIFSVSLDQYIANSLVTNQDSDVTELGFITIYE